MGQYADEETGLCCTRFRYFDPEIGRWCSPDPLGFSGGRDPFGFDGSPTTHADPFGLSTEGQGEGEGVVLVADHQTAGRGRLGKGWHSRPGYRALWRHFCNVTRVGLERECKSLGVTFNLWKGESDAEPFIPEIVEDLKARGISEFDQGAWIVRVYVKPFVDWIWGGCLLMAFGGLLAASDRRYRAKVKSEQTVSAAVGAGA